MGAKLIKNGVTLPSAIALLMVSEISPFHKEM